MAVRPGVGGSAAKDPGEVGIVGLFTLLLSWVTGRIVAPLNNGELDADFGEQGVKGLGRSELCALGVMGDESLPLFVSAFNEPRSRLGTVDCREGMLALVGRGRASIIGNERGYEREAPGSLRGFRV